MSGETDQELLERFAATGEEPAFALLVQRHAGMVLGVAWRRTGDRATAEEISQNVFAILARKARTLRRTNLAGWLHHAAVLEARNASRKATRYRDALTQFSKEMSTTRSPREPEFERICPYLDEAMSSLPSEARHLVVLRYFERHSIPDIASATGMTVDACRKRIQRALDLLDRRLGSRGPPRPRASLATILAAQSLCLTPASEAAIAAAALQTAPTLTTASLAAHTLFIMNTATIVKTSAVALIIATIPIVVLWKKNAALEATTRRLEAAAAKTSTAPPPRPRPAPAPGTEDLAAAAALAPPLPAPATGPQTAEAASPSFESLLKRAKDKSKRRADMEFTRICLNLPDLDAGQKARIKEALETKSTATLEEMLAAFQSGSVARGLQHPESLTPEEKVALAKIDPRKTTLVSIDEELKSILTEDQYARHAEAQTAKRISEAEEVAADTLKIIGRSFDLTSNQKDEIFQDLAQYELSGESAAPVNPRDPFPQIGSRDDARDRIIRTHLTPAQAAVFDQIRAAERAALKQEMMQFYSHPKGTR